MNGWLNGKVGKWMAGWVGSWTGVEMDGLMDWKMNEWVEHNQVGKAGFIMA